jgi:hypothetical protein
VICTAHTTVVWKVSTRDLNKKKRIQATSPGIIAADNDKKVSRLR